jgi:DOPA 4,5-dioxygenase
MIERPRNAFASYHAHVYFDERTTEQARELCETAASRFGVEMGRVHQKLVGPHPRWSCQLAFDAAQFDGLVPWLEAHRARLTVLIHGARETVSPITRRTRRGSASRSSSILAAFKK